MATASVARAALVTKRSEREDAGQAGGGHCRRQPIAYGEPSQRDSAHDDDRDRTRHVEGGEAAPFEPNAPRNRRDCRRGEGPKAGTSRWFASRKRHA